MPKNKTQNVVSLRRAKKGFRLSPRPLPVNVKTVWVFATRSPVLDANNGTNCGLFGAPVGVLHGYQRTTDANGIHSVKLASDSFVTGRLCEVTEEELARLDQVSEECASQHRFLAEIKGPMGGFIFAAWVFQDIADMTPVEAATSALNSPARNLQLKSA